MTPPAPPPRAAIADQVTTCDRRVVDCAETSVARMPGQQQLADILDSTMDAVIMIDSSFRVQLFNRAAVDMFGHPKHEILGGTLDRLLPEAHRPGHQNNIAAFAAAGISARAMGAPRQLTGLRADGAEFPIEASISRTGTGVDALMTVVVRDATRLRDAEQAREAHAAAAAAHQAKMEFLSRMGHELRTPLNAVLGLTRLIQSTTAARLTHAESEQIALVLAAAERLHTLIEGMLAIGNDAGPPATRAVAEPCAVETDAVVLYIEDDPVNVLLVEQLLARLPGVRVVAAADGLSGIEAARALQPDLVLLDMHLPDITGLEVLRRLRGEPSTRHLRVAALSAGGTPEQVAATMAAGALAYWRKPIDFGAFLGGIRAVLQPAPIGQPPDNWT